MFRRQTWHQTIRILTLGGMVAASGALAISAPTSASAAPKCPGITQHTSPNWSGIVDDCNDYYVATGTVKATCASGQGGSAVAYFAGLGGEIDDAPLIQTVLSDLVYSADGTHHFTVYAETQPTNQKINITPPGGVHCGDRVKLSVTQYNLSYNDHDQVYWVGDLTTRQYDHTYVRRSAAWPGTDGSSAEFIVERPEVSKPANMNCPFFPLTKPGLWPIPSGLQTSYIDTYATPHPDVTMMSVPYWSEIMISCATDHHVLQEPSISPQYDDMFMRWLAAS